MSDRPTIAFTNALAALKRRLFPSNYEPCGWIDGKQMLLKSALLNSPTNHKCSINLPWA